MTRAPYATRHEESRGRLHPEPDSKTRTPFQRDRDRIIHSTAFRRLKHKTQVFIAPDGDHYRTRLTHSLEVSQIARSLARSLGMDEDLAEALALAHDFGHPPFGHAGETALDEAMRPFGGFDHNDQTLRVLVKLERRYAAFDGLNLTWEVLEDIVKHNGPVGGPHATKDGPTPMVGDYSAKHDLELDTFAGPEAQVAALADDIAYDTHDLDDGLRAGVFMIADLDAVPHVADAFAEIRADYPDIEPTRAIHETVRELIGTMVVDVLEESVRRLEAAGAGSAAEVRALDHPIVAFSDTMGEKDRALKAFLFWHMYRHDTVTRETDKAKRIVRELFERFLESPEDLPREWQRQTDGAGSAVTARVVADYIAGMTDRYAMMQHDRLFKVETRV